MAQIFDRSSNALARMSLVLTGLIVIALGLTLDELQRSPWVTRQGQRADQPVPFSHKHHVEGLGLQCQYCHTTVEKSSYAGIPPTKTCMNCHAQIWTDAQLLEPVRASWATGASIRHDGWEGASVCRKSPHGWMASPTRSIRSDSWSIRGFSENLPSMRAKAHYLRVCRKGEPEG